MGPRPQGLVHDAGRSGVVVRATCTMIPLSTHDGMTGHIDARRGTMRTPFTGCGTALVTPFTRDGAARRGGRAAARAAADRRRHSLPRALRHDRREPDAHRRTSGVRVVELVVEEAAGRVPVLAGAGGYDTQRGHRGGAADGARRRRRHPVGHAVLQQADAGRAVPALQRDRRAKSACRSSSTTCRAAPAATSTSRTLVRLSAVPEHRRRQGSVGQRHADVRDLPRGARGLPRAVGRRCADAAGDGGRRPRRDLGGSNEVPARDVADGGGRRARRLRGGAPRCTSELLPLMQVNFVESNPIPVKAAMAVMGLLEEVYRLPMVPPRDGVTRADPRRCCASSACRRAGGADVHDAGVGESSALSAAGAGVGSRGRRARCSRRCGRRSRRGEVRAAEPDAAAPTGWRVNTWVKQGILLGFRFGDVVDVSADHGRWPFFDKDTLPLKRLDARSGVRIVPGGSTVRDGAYLGTGVICMPPMYINIGALRRRRDAGRLARARRLVRADRPPRPPQRRRADRRRARAGRRAAGDRRGRRARRRQLRRVRRRDRQAPRGAGGGRRS